MFTLVLKYFEVFVSVSGYTNLYVMRIRFLAWLSLCGLTPNFKIFYDIYSGCALNHGRDSEVSFYEEIYVIWSAFENILDSS